MAYPINPIYKLRKNPKTEIVDSVHKSVEGGTMSIPFDETNIDYQEYLEWASIDGNTIQDADS